MNSEPNQTPPPDPNMILAQLSAMLQGQRPAAVTPFQPQPSFAQPGPNILAIAVPVEFAPGLRGYVMVAGADATRNPQAAIAALQAQGWPVHQYQPRAFNGGSGGGYQGGNFQRRSWGNGGRW